MKILIDRDPAVQAVARVLGVVDRKHSIPIVSNILLTASADGGLGLCGTDLDMQITEHAPCRAEVPGQITVPGATLHELLRNVEPGAELRLETTADDPRLLVRFARSRFQLPTLPPDGFPILRADDLGEGVRVSAKALARAIDKTRFAMASDDGVAALTGLYLHAIDCDGGNALRLAALDGLRLACSDLDAPDEAGAMAPVILPKKAVEQIRRLLDCAVDDEVRVATSSAKARFDAGTASLITKVIDAEFPPYAKLLARESDSLVRVDHDLFERAVKRTLIMAETKHDGKRGFKIAVGDGAMTLVGRNFETCQAVEEIGADYGGAPFEFGFNGRHLADIAARMDGETIELQFPPDPTRPGNVILTDSADARTRFMTAPLAG